MSRQFDDYYSSLPAPVREHVYEELVDYEIESEWKPIKQYPGYFVSRDGEVLSIRGNSERVLKTWPNQYGHRYVELHNGYSDRKFLVHRLVAEAFIKNNTAGSIVMHLDDNPTNNSVDNLRWGSQADNMHDCFAKERNFTKPVCCFETGKTYKSCAEAAKDFSVSRSLVTLCCENKCYSVKGKFHLCYAVDKDERMKNARWYTKVGCFKPLKAVNVCTGEELYFRSRQAASKYLGISDSGISSTINGRLHQSGGWIFENYEYDGGEIAWTA